MAGNGFCSKCGAVMYDGRCTSCGGGRFSGNIGQESVSSEVQNVRGGKRTFPVWAVVLAVIVGLFILVIALIGSVVSKVVNNVIGFSGIVEVTPEWQIPGQIVPKPGDSDSIGEWEDWYGQWGSGEIQEEGYVPSPSDDYLSEIVSSTVRGLSYDIAWNDTYWCADDEENGAAFYCYYPFIIDCDKTYVAEINDKIAGLATSFMPTTLSRGDYGYVDGFVTYMSEEKLSIVLEYYYDHGGNEEFYITALNFDMKTGKEISIQEMLPAFEFMADFREGCESQNGYYAAEVLDKMTNEDIQAAILALETGVAFYSPVGLDVGFNYPDGWMTVTFKFATY